MLRNQLAAIIGVLIFVALIAIVRWSSPDCKNVETRKIEMHQSSKYGKVSKEHEYRVCLD